MAASSNIIPPPTTTTAENTTVTSAAPAANTASPPWTQIVAPPSPAANVVSGEIPAEGGDGNAAVAAVVGVNKKPAWNKKPMTMAKPPSTEVGQGESGGAAAVIGADLWPSLMECTTKSSPKTFSSSNVGSPLSVEVTGIDSSSTATVASSMRSPTLPTQKPTTSYPKNSNHGQVARQKSVKREGEGNAQPNGGFSHQPPQSAGDGSHYHHHSHGSPKPNSGSHPESFGKDNVQGHNNRESGQKNASGEYSHHRNSFKKGNGGPQSRGDGSHQNYGGRRSNQERGNHDWNHQKSFNGRDGSMQPAVVSRGFVRPPPVATPFIHPPTMQPLINPLMGPDVPFIYIPPGMQLVPPMPHMYFPAPDLELCTDIMKQIDYYFSNENLVRDTFLRQKMDENGWVSVGVISEFNRVKSLTSDTFQILEAIRHSTVVEVQGDKIRRRNDWMRWVMPPAVQFPMSDSQSPQGPPVSSITDRIQSISVEEKTNDPSIVKAAVGGSSSAPQSGVEKANPGGC